MKRSVYLSILSKISTVTPLFAKAMLELAFSRFGRTPETATPAELISILRNEIDPLLSKDLKTTNSIVLAGAAYIVIDEKDEIVFTNSAAKQLIERLLAAKSQKTPLAALKANGFLKSCHEVSNLEVWEFTDPICERTYNVGFIPVRKGERQSNQYMVALVQDFTLRKEIEFELVAFSNRLHAEITAREAAEQLTVDYYAKMVSSAKMVALGEMAGGIAHEINTPLGIISLLSEQVQEMTTEGGVDLAELKERVGMIRDTTHRITKIIKGLQDFARDGSHDTPRIHSIKTLIDEALVLCQERFKMAHTELRLGDISETLVLPCRATEILQVLVNLLNNARESVESLSQRWVRIEARDIGSAVEVAVTDSGPGLTKEVQQRLFHPFFTTKEIGKGTGLGLSISMGLIEGHRGSLALDTGSANTRFVISLPKK